MNLKNHIITGTILGILLPAITLLLIYAFGFPGFKFVDYFRYTYSKNILENFVSLSGIPNLLLFFLFLKFHYYESGKGIILATFILVIIVIFLKFIF